MYREIEIFRAVMLTGSTSQAANKLNISQPAVSQAVRKLEESAGLRLFERTRGRLVPTREANGLMVDVDRHFTGMEAIEHRIRSLKEMDFGRLNIAAYPALGNQFIPRTIATFNQRHGNVPISLRVLSSKDVYHQVVSGQVDFGLMANEMPTTGLEHSTFLSCPGVIIMSRRHPLASKSLITPQDLAQTKFLALNNEDTTRQELNTVMAANDLELPVHVETPYSITICEMARLNVGVGLVNPIAAYDFMHTNMVIKRFSEQINFTGLLVFRPGNTLSENAKSFIRTLRIQLDKDLNDVSKQY
jgi:DNA-binding transcriptional LysR family regulator